MKGEAELNCSRAQLITSYSTADRFLVCNADQERRASGTVSASELSGGADKCIAWLVLCMDTFVRVFGSLLAQVYRCFDRRLV
jgi:hypothetical protein